MVAGFGPRKRSKCARAVTVLVLEVLVLALEVAWEPGPRAGVWAGETAVASSAAVRPGCGGEVPPGLEAAWGPMTGMAGVVPCEAAEAGPAGVLGQVAVREALSAVVLPGGVVGSGGLVALVH